ncbi:hypothetical protein FHT98_0607 [Bosea sp. AK1]|nr:hypothetical protein [Bosea sp. AK1]TQI72887.1 hypothetical protein FHT98_0607 [Bosea sp. AK1]
MTRAPSDEDTDFDAAIETVPQWLLAAINLVGVMVFAMLRI